MSRMGSRPNRRGMRVFNSQSGAKVFGLAASNTLAQLLACLEVRRILGRNLDLLPCLRVATDAWRAVVEAEAAESTNLDALALGEALRHGFEDHLHGDLCVFRPPAGDSELRVERLTPT